MKRDRSAENRERYVRSVRARLGSHVIVTHRPGPKKRKRGRAGQLHRITAGAWLRFLTLSYVAGGVWHSPLRCTAHPVRQISAALGTDPTSVAQAICELKRLRALPSHFGRTPIRAKP